MNSSVQRLRPAGLAIYFVIGILFGIVLTKAEVISWFRIQEMFRFQSFHMYGVIGSSVAVAALSLVAIKKFNLQTVQGDIITIPDKHLGKGTRYWLGGSLFGLGWALTGACPGPMVVLIGNGVSVAIIMIASGIVGTWTYAHLRPKLPH